MFRRISTIFGSPTSPTGSSTCPNGVNNNGIDGLNDNPNLLNVDQNTNNININLSSSNNTVLSTSHDSGISTSFHKNNGNGSIPLSSLNHLDTSKNDAITSNVVNSGKLNQPTNENSIGNRDDWVVITDDEDDEYDYNVDTISSSTDLNSILSKKTTISDESNDNKNKHFITNVNLPPTLNGDSKKSSKKALLAKERKLAMDADRLQTLAQSDYIVSTTNGAVASLITSSIKNETNQPKNNKVNKKSKKNKSKVEQTTKVLI